MMKDFKPFTTTSDQNHKLSDLKALIKKPWNAKRKRRKTILQDPKLLHFTTLGCVFRCFRNEDMASRKQHYITGILWQTCHHKAFSIEERVSLCELMEKMESLCTSFLLEDKRARKRRKRRHI